MGRGREVKLSLNPDSYSTWYGWLEFGTIPRGAGYGYTNQHYDWSYLSLMGFLRFTDYKMLDIAEEFLRHKADIIIVHDPDATSGWDYENHGGQRYEADSLFSYNIDYGPYSSKPRMASHFWTKGLTLQYLLTGETLYYDAVKQSFDHIVRVKTFPTMKNSETRNSNRGIDALCNGYALTGDINYLTSAYEIFTNNLLVREGGPSANDGTSGWIHSTTYGVSLGYDAIQQEPLVKLYNTLTNAGLVSEANNLKAFLFRWGKWTRDTYFNILPSGQYNANKTQYHPFMAYQGWSVKEGLKGGTDGQYSEAYADLFALLFKEAPNSEKAGWLNLSRSVFKDYHFYRNTGSWTDTRFDINNGFGTEGFTYIQSGSWKIAKAITKPMFYIRTEWEESQKTVDVNPPLAPTGLRIK